MLGKHAASRTPYAWVTAVRCEPWTTMGHYDEDALEACLACPVLEVGLVPSARRAEAVREELRCRGLDESALARIRTPAGRIVLHEGGELYFCSADCARRFQAQPELFAKPRKSGDSLGTPPFNPP